MIITNAETDLAVMIAVRHGTAHAALDADEDLEFLFTRLREKRLDVDIEVRADSDFGVPQMYEVSERLGVWYTFRIGMISRLQRASDDFLAQAAEVSGWHVGPGADRDHEGRSARGGHQSPSRRHQSARRADCPAMRLL